ncbi:hypothetical protein J2W27_001421 [Variovorax boronicumulans]|nr:hypothetical protein [Variovorax boronicumulans]
MNRTNFYALAGFPAGAMGVMAADAAAALLAGIRAGRSTLCRLPKHLFQGAQWLDGKG